MKKGSRNKRDLTIYREYHGLNEDQTKIPAMVLARRYSLTRGRIYQIIDQQENKQKLNNPRIPERAANSAADAEKVAEILGALLEA